MSKTIVRSVLGVLTIKNKIVLVKRRDIPIWVLPGGEIEEDETPEEAILREMREETGYGAKIDKKIALYSSPSTFLKPVYLYKMSLNKGDQNPITTNKEVKELNLFPYNNLPSPIAPYYSEWIKDALEGNPYFERKINSINTLKIIKYFFSHPIICLRYILTRMNIHINT